MWQVRPSNTSKGKSSAEQQALVGWAGVTVRGDLTSIHLANWLRRCGWLLTFIGWVAAELSFVGPICAAEPFDAVVVKFNDKLQPTVSRIKESSIRLATGGQGLVVWQQAGREHWQVFRGSWTKPDVPQQDQPVWLVGTARSSGGADSSSPDSVAQLTTQLDPLLSPSVIKAIRPGRETGFLTPPDGSVLLGPQFTIRRETKDGLPQAIAVLTGHGTSVRIALPKDRATLSLAEVAELPAAWKEGLPAGKYTLQLEAGSKAAATFEVESTARRQQAMKPLEAWRQLATEGAPSLDALVAVEYLTTQRPQPYLADALDVLDRLPEEQQSHSLQRQRQRMAALLQSTDEPLPELTEQPTGVAEIDAARRLIAQGRFDDAYRRLDSAAASQGARTRALSDLYRGVILAESGLGQESAADFYFRRAANGLSKESALDRFRAHNNYANFLLNRTQDRVSNHAFQMAAGVQRLFSTALLSWEEARLQYETARDLARELGPGEQASVEANLSRSYAALADLIATLDTSDKGERQLAAAEQAVNDIATGYARQAAGRSSDADPYAVAVAETMQAQLAFRARDWNRCREHTGRAMNGFVASGSLSGVESLERLLGLVELRMAEPSAGQQRNAAAHRRALVHFQRSHWLAELLRSQVPADRVGLTRAGFFARRTFVNERIVELLIEAGDVTEALHYAELAKARALQDLLALEGSSGSAAANPARDLRSLLREWPSDALALEYFLTSERAWVFVIADGRVKAYPLLNDDRQPLPARELVAQVRALLRSDLEQYSPKIQKRLLDGKGFDHAWQDRLHALQRLLIPEEVKAQISAAKTLLIVPHHILHYFPFAALVIEPDQKSRGPLEMVQPRFLIDEPCDCCYAPSLAVWDSLRQRPDRPISEAAAMGIASLPGAEPLPGVVAELQSLRLALGRRLKIVVTDEDAHRANALSLFRGPGLLLVATHGQNWPDQPLASEILLYPQGSDKGRLTAADLYASPVGRDLTVLSACYTALADKSPLPGDDLFGLQRALLQSGGRTVVAGQWDIYDRTGPELMRSFFAHLAQGKPAHQALAQSQRQFLKKLRESNEAEPWLHPYFWSAFTVCGDDRTHFQAQE